MDVFFATLTQMLVMFLLMLVGFLLRKYRILPADGHVVLAKLETYVLVPALTFSNWANNCTFQTLVRNSDLILYGLFLMLIAVVLSEPLSRIFVRNSQKGEIPAYERHIYKYAMIFGNYGFLGNFIVLSIWGDERFFQYSMFTLAASFLSSSLGVMILIPRHRGKTHTIKNMLKQAFPPPMIAMLLGGVIGILNLTKYLPEVLVSACTNAGDCMGPIAMILAGFVVGGYDWKELIRKKKVYVVTLLRLVVIPAVFVLLLKLIGTNDTVLSLALVLFGTPIGLNTIVYPTAYGGDTRTGASMVMISHILSVITIPLMYLVFIVVL